MNRPCSRSLLPAAVLVLVLVACAGSVSPLAHATDDPADARVIPAPFAPLEYLVGEWKGQAIPKDSSVQQFRGWTEKHAWAWTFTKGKPTGLSFTIKDGKVLASGALSFDPQKELYRLEGKEPGARGKVIAFEGKLDSSGKQLVLDQTHEESDPAPADGQLRTSLRPNANFLRYTMLHDRCAPGGGRVHPDDRGRRHEGGERRSPRERARPSEPRCIYVTGNLRRR